MLPAFLFLLWASIVRLRTRLPDAGGACGVKANVASFNAVVEVTSSSVIHAVKADVLTQTVVVGSGCPRPPRREPRSTPTTSAPRRPCGGPRLLRRTLGPWRLSWRRRSCKRKRLWKTLGIFIVVGARWAYVGIGHRYVFVGIDCLCGVGIDCLFVGID